MNQHRLQCGVSTWALHYINYVFRQIYEGWNFNSGNYLFTTDTK